MDSIEVSPEKSFCRLCLSFNGKLHQVFRCNETEALAVPLSLKISLCTSVPISKRDALPQKICQNCLNFVNDWYFFRIKCVRNDFLLRKNCFVGTQEGNWLENVIERNIDCKSQENKSQMVNANAMNPSLLELEVGSQNVCDEPQRDIRGLPGTMSQISIAHPSALPLKKKYCCDQCPDSFYFIRDLKRHKKFLHNFEDCRPVTGPKKGMDNNLEGIRARTRYEMKCCSKIFFSKSKFKKHYNEDHPGEKPFMCETCGKKDFISEVTLKRHKVLHTGKFRCEICFKTFTCNAILILHKRDKHENDKPFVCDLCGKRFVTELLMNYHKRFHTGEKKYVCEECGLAVVTSSSLAKHKRIHSKEKPHVCHICGKGFIVKNRLVEHLRVHTGERPYKCSTCEKGFTMRDKLKRHMQVHSGEKLFSCEYCGHRYSTKYGLFVHLKSHA